jgi:hypothetical protein
LTAASHQQTIAPSSRRDDHEADAYRLLQRSIGSRGIAAMRIENAPDYLAVIPGILIGLGIIGLIHKRRTACTV